MIIMVEYKVLVHSVHNASLLKSASLSQVRQQRNVGPAHLHAEFIATAQKEQVLKSGHDGGIHQDQ